MRHPLSGDHPYIRKIAAIERVKAGESVEDVAADIGRSPVTVRNWMEGRGVSPADWSVYYRQVRDEQVFMYHQANPDATLEDMARVFGNKDAGCIADRLTRRYKNPPVILPSRINDMNPYDYREWQHSKAA